MCYKLYVNTYFFFLNFQYRFIDIKEIHFNSIFKFYIIKKLLKIDHILNDYLTLKHNSLNEFHFIYWINWNILNNIFFEFKSERNVSSLLREKYLILQL